MRRKDREVTDKKRIKEIILSCGCLRLGIYDEEKKEVYIVPVDFGYEETSEGRYFYFHGAKQGRKAELLKKYPNTGFELDAGHELVTGEKACDYSSRFMSVIGTGTVKILKDEETKDKKHALNAIMLKACGRESWEFSENMLRAVNVYVLKSEELSCKEHL